MLVCSASAHRRYPPPKTLTPNPRNPNPKTLTFQRRTVKPTEPLTSSSSEAVPSFAIQRIADKLRSLGFTEDGPNPKSNIGPEEGPVNAGVGEIFIPLPVQLPKYRVGHTLDPSWSTPQRPSGKPYQDKEGGRVSVGKVPTLAELNLSTGERRRLTRIGLKERRKLKVGKAGITEGVVNGIHERWRAAEVVNVVFEDLCKMNMKRTHNLLELKTGGLVVWRSGSRIILYRGVNYKYPYFISKNAASGENSADDLPGTNTERGMAEVGERGPLDASSSGRSLSPTPNRGRPSLVKGVGSPNRVRFQLPGEAKVVEEVNSLLDGLGPRYTDWWGYEPLPVDGDLLPAFIPGYRQPFRLLPYGVKPTLTNDEMNALRRLSQPLPCHFALGRDRRLMGLADSIVKLWEKCEIAKIAIKRGAPNISSKLMAEELKSLTGGSLLGRDSEFILLYRGKDFLPSAVSSVMKKRKHEMLIGKPRDDTQSGDSSGEQEDCVEDSESRERQGTRNQSDNSLKQLNTRSSESGIQMTSLKLSVALEKKASAERILADMEKTEKIQQPELEKESITREERYMLRKIGLKMKPYLLIGRRGVFSGTVENMHLHWKYRELVKVICTEKSLGAARQVACTLEAESGGTLVAVERVSKGYAIIIYRGKNYTRPARLRPSTLPGKKEALKLSVEAQRRKSLQLHVLEFAKNVDHLKLNSVEDKGAHSAQTSDMLNYQIKEEMNALESATLVASNSEPNISDQSDPLISHCNEEILLVRPLLSGNVIFQHTADDLGTNSRFNSSDDIANPFNESPIDQKNQVLENESRFESDGEHNHTDLYKPEVDDQHASMFSHLNDQLHEDATQVCKTKGRTSDKDVAGPSVKLNKSKLIESIPAAVKRIEKTSREVAVSSVQLNQSELIESRSAAVKGTEKTSREVAGSSVKLNQCELIESISAAATATKKTSKVVHLSNRDRLLLRRQALKMKKRPVLAVGKSNVMSGIAKQIKSHFERCPLAIVNIKGRAKGTSIREVVRKLEQETGALFVSQEPNKVILYRGWGADEEHSHRSKKANTQDLGKLSVNRQTVSPDLMAAIRFECGLQQYEDKKPSQSADM